MPYGSPANAGKIWTEMDILDLRQCLLFNDPTDKISVFLCRKEEEVVAKMRELRLGAFSVQDPAMLRAASRASGPRR
jgi:hypothetical protein